jgi:prepilin-type N-terminal cleavage/methylation domain-containing protein
MIKNSNRGFALIELMIVVAILGILGAIIVPNLYNRKTSISAKQFMYENSEVSYKVGNKIFNKYSTKNEISSTPCKGEIVIFTIGNNVQELLVTSNFQTIPQTKYEVKAS